MGPRRKRPRLSEDGADTTPYESKEKQPQTTSKEDETSEEQRLQHRRTLFVRSLAANTTTQDLTDHFSQNYPLKHAVAVLDKATKQCKGYGFVTFADAEDAHRAMEEFNGSTLSGRRIQVDVAEPRHRDELDRKERPSGSTKPKREEAEAYQPPKLIVRNLPWSIKEPEQLAVLFRSYGKVKHATLPQKRPGVLKGFGFVVLRGRKNAEKAIEGLNGKEIDGRPIAVDWAIDKETWEKLTNNTHEGDEANGDAAVADEKVEGPPGPSVDDGLDAKPGSNIPSGEESDEEVLDELDEDEADNAAGSQHTSESSVHVFKHEDYSSTLFVRNLPFTCDDEMLEEHFSQFGALRYARVVMDHVTERSRGTGFVRFVEKAHADACLKGAPKKSSPHATDAFQKGSEKGAVVHSVLQNEQLDPAGQYTIDGRVLQITRAVDRSEAARLTAEGIAYRGDRDKDKRRLYLLSEGTIPNDSSLFKLLSPSEIAMREASAKQRKTLVEKNPSLHLSLTRLSIRNIPRSIASKDLKALAREAVVGFATDVKSGVRQSLSKEELRRGDEKMAEAERERKLKGKGVVKQAKVVFEGREGGKTSEASGAGRSRGYGFVEYYTHRSALMGLRWLNGRAVSSASQQKKGKALTMDIQEKNKRLIVEFALENAQVVKRRKERETKAQHHPKVISDFPAESTKQGGGNQPTAPAGQQGSGDIGTRKRKRGPSYSGEISHTTDSPSRSRDHTTSSREKVAKRQKIIGRKRMTRRMRKKEAKI